MVCAASSLQCERGVYRPPLDLRRADAGRTLMIHNDKAAVAEASVAGWPADVSSLMAMPVVRAGSAHATMEVAYRTGRRATEWEIALVQVAAARIAGFQDERYADVGSSRLHPGPCRRQTRTTARSTPTANSSEADLRPGAKRRLEHVQNSHAFASCVRIPA